MTIADELNTQAETTEEAATTTETTTSTAETTKTEAAKTATATGKTETKTEGDKAPVKTIATGDDTETEEQAEDKAVTEKVADRTAEVKAMREAIAKHASAGDKKAYDKELKRLERLGIERPEQIYGLYRDLERWRDEGKLVKIPGKDAKPEDIEAFRKAALGVPDKPEGYLKDVKLESGAVIGEADKPVVDTFVQAMHKSGAPPAVVNAALNWYYGRQEEEAAALDEADDAFRRESEKALKEELGPAFKRQTNAIGALFATAPGGADAKNPNSLYARIVGGRTADGKIIGNDPDIMRWLIGMTNEINPIASVVEDGSPSAMTIDNELAEIKKLRTTDPKRYNSAVVQARELELLTAQQKHQARNRA